MKRVRYSERIALDISKHLVDSLVDFEQLQDKIPRTSKGCENSFISFNLLDVISFSNWHTSAVFFSFVQGL